MMNCPGNDTLAELAFSEVSGGTMPSDAAALVQHIGTCTTCAADHAQWLHIAHAGRAAIMDTSNASPCPDENQLAEYFDNVLTADERESFEKHLSSCGPCVSQLCELHTILSEANPRRPIRRIALEWLQEGIRVLEVTAESLRPLTLSPAVVLRASHLPSALGWEAAQDGFTLQVTVQRTSSGSLTLHCALRLGELQVQGYRITLRAAGTLLESRVTDVAGMTEFFGLTPDEYTLEVALPGGPLTVAVDFPI